MSPGPRVVALVAGEDLREQLDGLGLSTPRPVLVLVGGAGGMTTPDVDALATMLRLRVVPIVLKCGALVVDGGTDAGVMRAMGRARATVGKDFPLVGVSPAARTETDRSAVPDDDQARVEPHHSHALLVPGDEFGDEARWIASVARILAGPFPSVTLLVNGGDISIRDAQLSLAHGRPLIVLSGSGRVADDIAAAPALPLGEPDSSVAEVAGSSLTYVVQPDGDQLERLLRDMLGANPGSTLAMEENS
jgi:SLOG in TRPM, prokaryote